jgi:DNA-binding NtrC family response regulator
VTDPIRVLHVEDEPNARRMVADLFGRDVDLVSAASAEEALERCRAGAFDLTLLDWTLPGLDGGQFLAATRESGRAGRVVVVTALGTLERAVEALRRGAFDFLVKPVDPDVLLALVEKVRRAGALLEGASRASPRVERAPAAAILGRSGELLSLKARLELVASSDATVLIVGESGTGKELVARALHEASGRHRAALVAVNCAAIPDALFESELFGHARGAFTGAAAERPGLFELAHGGTLFLDEVGELAPAAQAKLLRALETRTVRRVGESRERAFDARVIAATNRDLELEADRGAFREDLLFRLDVIRLEVPPLRGRLADLPELLGHFVRRHAAAFARPEPPLAPALLDALAAHDWPGNIRELETAAKRIVLLGADAALDELRRRTRRAPTAAGERGGERVNERSFTPAPGEVAPLAETIRRASRDAILAALRAAGGSRTRAAELLEVSRKTLFNKMQELGIREDTSWR